jgi:hypothetical protein
MLYLLGELNYDGVFYSISLLSDIFMSCEAYRLKYKKHTFMIYISV